MWIDLAGNHGVFLASERRSFTLVELLVALALAGLVAGLTGNIAVHVVSVRDTLERQTSQQDRVRSVWDRLEQDLRLLLGPPSGARYPVALYDAGLPIIELSALSTLVSSQPTLHAPLRPCVVRYRVSTMHVGEHRIDLVREVIDQTDPHARPETETIAADLTTWDVSVLVGHQWVPKFPTENRARRNATPRALRVTLGWNDEESVSRTFMLERP